MKPPNVTSVMLVGPRGSHKSSFLMQGAVHYAGQGHTVVYITATEFDSLPLPVQGMAKPTPDVFSLIKFLYLPGWQDLLQHIFSLHLHALVPTVLIVEALDHFSTVTNNFDLSNASNCVTEASHAALVCAALLDGAAVCARKSKSKAHLIVSYNHDIPQDKLLPLTDIFFTDVVWLFEKNRTDDSTNDDKEYCMTNLETAGSQARQYKIFLKPGSECSAVVINRVSLWENFESSNNV